MTYNLFKGNSKQSYNFNMLMKILLIIYRNIQSDTFMSKRELFYADPAFFGNQSKVDTITRDISCLLRVPRSILCIVASSSSLVYGRLSFRDNGRRVDCGLDNQPKSGTLIPQNVQELQFQQTDAEFILVVEKDTVFQKLIYEEILKKFPKMILVTGKGFPSFSTRLFVRKLSVDLSLSIFYLGDWDPFGFDILNVYAFGGTNSAGEAFSMCNPNIVWIGPFLQDFLDEDNILQSITVQEELKSQVRQIDGAIPMEIRDTKILDQLKSKEYFILKRWDTNFFNGIEKGQYDYKYYFTEKMKNKILLWKEQLEIMERFQIKFQVEGLSLKNPLDLIERFLPKAMQRAIYQIPID